VAKSAGSVGSLGCWFQPSGRLGPSLAYPFYAAIAQTVAAQCTRLTNAALQAAPAAVDVCLGSILDRIGARGGLAAAMRAGHADAVGGAATRPGVAAWAAAAPAVRIRLLLILDTVRTARGLAGVLLAYLAQAVLRSFASTQVRAPGTTRPATVRVGFVAIERAVRTGCEGARAPGTDAGLTIGWRAAERADGARVTIATAIDPRLRAVLDLIVAAGGIAGSGRATAALAIGVGVATLIDAAPFATATAVRGAFDPVLDAVSAGRCETAPGHTSQVPAVLVDLAFLTVTALYAFAPTTVDICLVFVLNVVAAMIGAAGTGVCTACPGAAERWLTGRAALASCSTCRGACAANDELWTIASGQPQKADTQ
jgi:hypothetical protein